jgi:ferric-dicitrate binding protein FerR (iron transport regulator)
MSGVRFGCRVPVEPLSHQAWKRIESVVFTRLEERSELSMPPLSRPAGSPRPLGWHWRASMGCFLAAAAVASVIHLARSSGAGPDPELPSATDRRAPEGLHVATGAETRSVAIGAHRFTLSEHSEILANGGDTEGWRVELWRGRVELDVAPRRDQPPFTIRSGEVELRVMGTRLSVQREGASTEVHVSRGIVEVVHQGRVARLRPGDRWRDGILSGTAHGTTGAARENDASRDRGAARSTGESRPEALAGARWFGRQEPSPGGQNLADVESLRARLGGGAR